MSAMHSLYQKLPSRLRDVAATARGFELRWWRYGRRFSQLVPELRAREAWSEEEWRRYQDARLQLLLAAAARTPHYRDAIGTCTPDKLESFPVLEKDSIRADATTFLRDDVDRRFLFHEHTSGTTGKPLDLWWSRTTTQTWYALFERRIREWGGVSYRDRWAHFGGQLIVPFGQSKPPFWVVNRGLNQIYFSSYHLAPAYAQHYFAALRQYRPRYILGYVSSLAALAQLALEQGERSLRFDVAFTNAEPLLNHQRDLIQEAFHCRVKETYSGAEIVALASECEEGRLHLSPDCGVTEVLSDDGSPVAPGESGHLIATGLVNLEMPLVRYRTGDRVQLAKDQRCPCGRSMPIVAAIEGRNDDIVWSRDGRRIGRLDPVFKASLGIREAQIIQEDMDLFRIRYVRGDAFSPSDAASMVERLQDRVGAVEVRLEEVNAIERSSNGKFRAVISKVTEPRASR